MRSPGLRGGLLSRKSGRSSRTPVAVVVTAALDAYGSDLQMMQTAIALHKAGWRVVVLAPRAGRLAEELTASGIELRVCDFPVLVRSSASPAGLVRMLAGAVSGLPGMIKMISGYDPDVVYVNTLTMPWWLLAGRIAGVRTVCHVHEAEERDPLPVRWCLAAPLLLARLVVVNSNTTWRATAGLVPGLRRRTRLIYNGVEPPEHDSELPDLAEPVRLVTIGRISPRKAPQVALEATAILRAQGRDVRLDLCGSAADGKEWFEDQLLQRATESDLAGAVRFLGYTAPVWPALAAADIVIAPSLGESFGNAVVEGQMACRPVVATAVQGHLETVSDQETGLLVPCEDPAALADAIGRLIDDPQAARRMARRGHDRALAQFSSQRYRTDIEAALSELTRTG